MNTLLLLGKLDARQYYRLFVDGRFYVQEHGWEGYERRAPGSLEGMSEAYAFMLENFDLQNGLKVNYVSRLHDLVFSKIESKARRNRYPGQIREFQVSFLLRPRTVSSQGLAELLQDQGLLRGLKDADTKEYKDIADVYQRLVNGESIRYLATIGDLPAELAEAFEKKQPMDLYAQARKIIQKNICSRLEGLFEEYNKKIGFYAGEQKMYFLVDVVKRAVRLHPFVDGNARIFINILLNHLLLFHGFLPALYEDPSIFDGRTTTEILTEIQHGQMLFQQLVDDPQAKVFDHSVLDESAESHRQEIFLMDRFIKVLATQA